MRSLIARYDALFRHAGTARFAALSLLMRMPIGTVGLATLLHVRELTSSIAFAGSVVGAQLVSAAITAPLLGRVVDTRGPRGVLVATGVVSPIALGTLLAAGWLALSRPGMLACAIVVGAFSPPVTVLVRTLWRTRLDDGPERQTAFALDAVILELAYTLGPLAIALAIGLASTTAAMGIAVAFLALAVPLLFASGGLAWWKPQPAGERHWLGPLTDARLWRLYAATFALTMAFGALEVGYPAFGRAAGADTWGPVLIAIGSVGSAIGGVVYGGMHIGTPLARLLPWLMATLAVPVALHLPVTDPRVLVPFAFAAGALIAPAMTTVSLLVSSFAPARYATEAFTWSATAIVTGIGLGMAGGGALVERFGPNGAFAFGVAAALAGAALALSLRRS
ncbi:MAG TPA: MFS transporter [Casimicrobiaceae bacterium]|nr:MFS transporter [Casimicrobiaceae bacterium]